MAHIILFIDTVHFSLKDDLTNLGFECIEAYTWSLDDIKDFLPKVYGIVIRSRFKLTADVLEQAKNLKFIARFGAGLENIDVPFATRRGILCLNAPDGNRNAVAEHTLGLMLNLFKKINTSHREVQQGLWRREDNRGIELEGKTVAIIGYGNTGSQLVKLLHGFDINCLVYDKYKSGFGTPFIKEVQDYETIFEQADVII
jgi:D-3-phosphoglycerate dehydrogenase / 2-oxoglutarate reductase